MKFLTGLLVLTGCAGMVLPGYAESPVIIISEFMAVNDSTLQDEDNDYSDWLELYNTGTGTVSLLGYYLTDDAGTATKWALPATNLAAGEYLVIFASDKNRSIAGNELHTNFKLSGSGEFLGLYRTGGVSFDFSYSPSYPEQVDDVSYGIGFDSATETVLGPGAACAAHVPGDDTLGDSWQSRTGFDDSGWQHGVTGVGYDNDTTYQSLIGTDVKASMYEINATCYIRIPFTMTDVSAYSSLCLNMKYDAGFIAYINGIEVAQANAPAEVDWDSASSVDHADSEAVVYEPFILYDTDMLTPGTNMLAIHSLNRTAVSSDSLIMPELIGNIRVIIYTNMFRYFMLPTPGKANGTGVQELGPIISDVAHEPFEPQSTDDVIIHAGIVDGRDGISEVVLHYRLMFSAEQTIAMHDDGQGNDAIAGDGIYTATLPSGMATAGQMVRYYITAKDGLGNPSRWPLEDMSAEYLGYVIRNPALTNPLPVLHWFVENYNAAVTREGTYCSLYYQSNFYDHVFVRLRGGSAAWAGWPKPHLKFDFAADNHFYFRPGEKPAEEFNLNTTYSDKAYMRQTLSFEAYTLAGCPASDSFMLRVQRNGAFYSVAVFVEQPDKYMLRRLEMGDGALYKMYNRMEYATTWVSKKTRKDEPFDDLEAFIEGIKTNNPDREEFVFDNVNLPRTINYIAISVLINETDHLAKNYYVYRDTEGTKEWLVIPWDKDLTWGRNYVWPGDGVLSDDIWAEHDPWSEPRYGIYELRIEPNHWNRLIDAVLTSERGLEMYVRRLRTIMDEYLQPPGTPQTNCFLETHISEMYAAMEPDVLLDRAKWGNPYGEFQTFADGVRIMTNNYLARRRVHLYNTHSVHNGGVVPDSEPANPVIVFGDIHPAPESGDCEEEYFTLLNTNSYAVDISGWSIAGSVAYAFQPGAVIPANDVVYVSPNVNRFRARSESPTGGEGRFVQGNYEGHLRSLEPTLMVYDRKGREVALTNYVTVPSVVQRAVRITEIMYNPGDPPVGSSYASEEYEFIEMNNTGTQAVDLSAIRFSDGIDWVSGFPQELGTNCYGVLVKNPAAFASIYYTNDILILGTYDGRLDNAGEQVILEDGHGGIVLSFSYDDGWYPLTDGSGHSLVCANYEAMPSAWDSKANWRTSYLEGGSPGREDVIPEPVGLSVYVLGWLGAWVVGCLGGSEQRAEG